MDNVLHLLSKLTQWTAWSTLRVETTDYGDLLKRSPIRKLNKKGRQKTFTQRSPKPIFMTATISRGKRLLSECSSASLSVPQPKSYVINPSDAGAGLRRHS